MKVSQLFETPISTHLAIQCYITEDPNDEQNCHHHLQFPYSGIQLNSAALNVKSEVHGSKPRRVANLSEERVSSYLSVCLFTHAVATQWHTAAFSLLTYKPTVISSFDAVSLYHTITKWKQKCTVH